MIALKAFIESIKEVKYEVGQVRDLYFELAETIKNTEPKVIPLIHLIEESEKEVKDLDGGTIDQVKRRAIQILKEKHEEIITKTGKVIEYSLSHTIEQGSKAAIAACIQSTRGQPFQSTNPLETTGV